MSISELQKKGQASLSGAMYGLIGAVVLIFMVSALAPDVFTELLNVNTTAGAPAWLGTVLPIVVGAGFIFIIWRAVAR